MSQHAHHREIVAIGARIVGATIAFRLAQRGAVVTVTDSGEPGQGASTVSSAWINARDKNPRIDILEPYRLERFSGSGD